MRIYFGFPGWGWRMYGIGYGTTWFLGLSVQIKSENMASKVSPWISVEDRLPSCELLPNGDTPTVIAQWAPGILADNLIQISTVNTVYMNMYKEKFTHWMPLPDAPEDHPKKCPCARCIGPKSKEPAQ